MIQYPKSCLRTLGSFLDSISENQIEFAYLYTDLRLIGQERLAMESKDSFLQRLIDIFLDRDITVLIPTFTYTSRGTFNPTTNITKLGALNSYIQRHQNSTTSEHPMFSFSAIGPRATIVNKVGKSAFGFESVFHRLLDKNCWCFHIGRPLGEGNTVVHAIEQHCGVTYRQNVEFSTRVIKDGVDYGKNYTAFLRRRDIPGKDFATNFEMAADLLLKNRIMFSMDNKGPYQDIVVGPYDAMFSFLSEMLDLNNKLFL
jgi:aminoglycoside N3'-acetyltransferase